MRSTMMDAPLSVAGILRHGSQWHGHRVVVTERADGSRRRETFAEVARRAAQLANGLEELGISGDQRVGTFMWNNQEHVEAYFAVPAMGAVLHTANIRLAPEQVIYTIAAAEDRVVIVDESLAATFAPMLSELPSVHTVVVNGRVEESLFASTGKTVISYEELVSGKPTERVWAEVDERDAASICFTTGTTGNPKGVAYSHRSIALQSLASATDNALRIGADDRMLVAVPMFHATAWGYPYSAFWFGADLVLLDRFLSPATILRAIEEERITFGNGVPTVWNEVLRLARQEPGRDLSSLRRVVVGGAALSRSLAEAFEKEFGVPLLQGWGMTETSPLITVARPPHGASPDEADAARTSQGRILAGVEVRLVEPATLEPVPADGETVGEFELRGPWIAGSYLGDEGADKFHDGWLRTGDIGTIDAQGYCRLTDRAKDVIKSGGEWISSVGLEEVLIAHPQIAMVTVIGVPDPRWDERPCAVIVPVPGERPDPEELRSWLAARVPRWSVPEYFSFVEAIPVTSVGKVDKKNLRRRHADGSLPIAKVAPKLP